MKRVLTLMAALAVAASLGGLATAASGWHVFATGQDKGDYGAFATASASASKPRALAIRVSAEADLNWTLLCTGANHVRPNQLLVISVSAAGSCNLSGSASTDKAGAVRVQLLRH